jgi:hypothetical protein
MLDNIEPLRKLTTELASKPMYLFNPALTWRMEGGGRRGGGQRGASTEGTNPPNGVIVDFLLRDQKPGTKVSLAFLGPDGKVIRELKGEVQAEATKPRELKAGVAPPIPAAVEEKKEGIKSEGGAAEENPPAEKREGEEEEEGDKLPDITNGHSRVSWNLRYPNAKKFPGMILWAGSTTGPKVPPGTYTAQLAVGDQKITAPFDVRQDPRTSASAADVKAQFDFVKSIYDKLSEINGQIVHIRDVRKALTDFKKSSSKPVADAANALDKKMTVVEEALYQTKNKSSQDPLNYPIRLNDKLAGVADSASTGSFAPTAQQIAVRDELMTQIDAQLVTLKAIWDTDLPGFNKLVKDQDVPAVK